MPFSSVSGERLWAGPQARGVVQPAADVRVERARGADGTLSRMAEEVRAGLLARPLASLPCKYFYDDRGSALFDEITRLPEYYQTRTEDALLEAIADEVIERTRPTELCELGSGIGRKVRRLLEAMQARQLLERCVLLDISEGFLTASVDRLAADYPGLAVRGVVGDFHEDLVALGPGGGRLALFFAGTIGNLHPADVPGFLRALAAQLAPGDALLVGLDLVKDAARLHAAYNDAAGVTAEFNRNVLHVVNRALGANFQPEAFEHVAFYDSANAWIEMRLRASRDMRVIVPGARLDLTYRAGDEIRTELSCKYTRQSFTSRVADTGLRLDRWFTDPDQLFASALLVRAGGSPAPHRVAFG